MVPLRWLAAELAQREELTTHMLLPTPLKPGFPFKLLADLEGASNLQLVYLTAVIIGVAGRANSAGWEGCLQEP